MYQRVFRAFLRPDLNSSPLRRIQLLFHLNFHRLIMSSTSPSATRVRKLSTTTASGGSKQKRTRTNSDSASVSSTFYYGYRFLDVNSQSVLYYPVGLPLVAAFHGKSLADIPSYPVAAFPEVMSSEATRVGDSILSEVYFRGIAEANLAQGLKEKIKNTFSEQFDVEGESNTNVSRDAGADLVFLSRPEEGTRASQTKSSTPLCIVEVGLSSGDWWKKVDQGKTYLDNMREQQDGTYCFDEPLLWTVITLENSSRDFDFQMAVFLCTSSEEKKEGFRVSLIWHKQLFAMDDAARSFGFLLRILPHFQSRRNQDYDGESEYFSSNCIKAGENVCTARAGLSLLQYQFFMCWASRLV